MSIIKHFGTGLYSIFGNLTSQVNKLTKRVTNLENNSGGQAYTGTGAAGQVTTWTGATALTGENNLWWDGTNNRLGINTNIPNSALHIVGNGQNSTTWALQVHDQFGSSNSLMVNDAGQVMIGTNIGSGKLHINLSNNGANNGVSFSIANNTIAQIYGVSGSPYINLIGSWQIGHTSSGTLTGTVASGRTLQFYTYDNSSSGQWLFNRAGTIVSTMNRLGYLLVGGSASPSASLHAVGNGTSSSTASGLFTDSAGNVTLRAVDNRRVGIKTSTPTATLHVAGSLAYQTNTSSTFPTINDDNHVIIYTGSGQSSSIPAASANSGRQFIIMNHGTGTITLDQSVTKSNGLTFTTIAAGEIAILISDGTVYRGFKVTSL